MTKIKSDALQFLRHVPFGYLLFTSLLILGGFFGAFEIIKLIFFDDTSEGTLQLLYFSRGVIVSFSLMFWAAWTVYNYRALYQEKLDTTEQQYRSIIEHSADAILTLNNDDEITYWNSGAEDILGWDREEILGKSIRTIIPEELIEKRELECLEFGMSMRGYVTNYETERLTKEGQKVMVNLTESFIRDENDEIIGRSQILRDLTDIKLREEQIQQSERLAAVGNMAAGVAHEVGNPLTAISSLVQVCQRKSDDLFVQEQLGKVRDHIRRISKIVQDLVDFSRPSSLKTEMMQVNEIISSAVGLLQHDARCRDVDFNLELSPDLPRLRGVPDHLHQVIVNLLLNAVDAMKDVDEPKVTLRSWQEGSDIHISVSDVGKGISAEEQKRIFEPFYTTKEVGTGTGLGLSVSHGIIKKMDGAIQVDSNPGEGATFLITLPLTRKDEMANLKDRQQPA